jgi:hypothetical protein
MIDNPGLAAVEQAKPLQVQFYESEAYIRSLSCGYKSFDKIPH